MSARILVCAVALAVGCGPAVDGADGEDDATSGVGEGSSQASTSGGSPGSTAADAESGTTANDSTGVPGSGGYEEDTGGTGCAFTCPPPPTTGGGGGGGVSLECDIVIQDCPENEKCMPWANDGGALWNATRCSPLDPDADAPGEPCTVEGSGVSGIDSCALGSVCFEVDPKTNEGVCRASCVASDEPCAGEQSCVAYVSNILELCVQGCDPLAPECVTDSTCAPADEGFVCTPGGEQALGDPCTHTNDCASGSLCISGDLLPACDTTGCCAAACNVEEPDVCDAELSCVAWDAEAAPPWDHVGVCIESD